MKRLALFLLILAAIMWGSAGIFIRMLTERSLDSITIVESRMLVATIIVFFITLIVDRESFKIHIKDFWIFACGGVLCCAAFNFLYNFAVQDMSLSLASIILNTSPIFVIIESAIIFKEKITAFNLIAIFLTLGGCVLVTGILDGSTFFTGKAIIIDIIAAILYGTYCVFSRVGLNKGYSSLTITFYSFACASLALAFMTDWESLSLMIKSSPSENLLLLFFHGLFVTAAPYLLFTISLKYVSTGKASIITSAQPVAAAIFGILIYKEYISLLAWIGIFIVLVALFLLTESDNIQSRLANKKNKETL